MLEVNTQKGYIRVSRHDRMLSCACRIKKLITPLSSPTHTQVQAGVTWDDVINATVSVGYRPQGETWTKSKGQ